MHPGFMGFWRRRHHHGGDEAWDHAGHCGPHGRHNEHGHHHEFGGHRGPPHRGPWGGGEPEGNGFGVRRPLRFLAWKLELEEEQVEKLARVLDELKTERAQAAVDERRSIAAFADATGADTFDAAKAKEAGDLRVQSAERLRDAVVTALEKLHAILDTEQRKRLSYLLRTGTLHI
jgi:Spy/CpxP family protein refolding chaperone